MARCSSIAKMAAVELDHSAGRYTLNAKEYSTSTRENIQYPSRIMEPREIARKYKMQTRQHRCNEDLEDDVTETWAGFSERPVAHSG